MTSMNRRNFVATLGLAGTALLAGCNGSEQPAETDDTQTSDDTTGEASYTLVKEGVLTNVAELGFSPFEYIDEDGNTVGFDVDLSNAIAERLGLTGGKADISIAGVTITDERLEDVDFSDPYLNSNQALIVAASSGYATDDLDAEEIQIACQTGTTGDAWIQENLPNATRVPLADVTAGMMGVSTGSYQAMVIDLPVAQNMLAQSFSDLTILEEIPTGEQYGIAVSYDNPGLKDAINDALAQIEEDGTMDELKQKWFGTSDI